MATAPGGKHNLVAGLLLAFTGCSDNVGFSDPFVYSTSGLDGAPDRDYNGDGRVDLSFREPSESVDDYGMKGIAVNTGDGFKPVQRMRGGDSVARGDFNGDGAPEFAIAKWGSFLDVWINDGSAHFTLLPVQQNRSWLGMLQTADVDGDGTTDLFAPWTEPSSNHVVGTQLFFGPDFVRTMAVDVIRFSDAKDINLDGHIDLISTSGIRFGDGTGLFTAPVPFTTADPYLGSVDVIDVNRDGLLDVVATGTVPKGNSPREDQRWFLNVLLGDGTGAFLPARTYFLYVKDYTFRASVVAGFEPDGRVALVVADWSGSLSYYPADADGYFGAPEKLTTEPCTMGLSAIDFDGDERLDLLAKSDPGSFCILYNER